MFWDFVESLGDIAGRFLGWYFRNWKWTIPASFAGLLLVRPATTLAIFFGLLDRFIGQAAVPLLDGLLARLAGPALIIGIIWLAFSLIFGGFKPGKKK
jgi:hypothetical protein